MSWPDLSATEVGRFFGADLDAIAWLAEEGNLDDEPGGKSGRLGRVVGGVSFDSFGGIGDLEFDGGREVDGDRAVFDKENFNFLAFGEEVFGIADEGSIETGGLEGLHVHEVVGSGLGVGKLELLAVGIDDVDLFA